MMANDVVDAELVALRKTFCEEARERLAEMEVLLLELEQRKQEEAAAKGGWNAGGAEGRRYEIFHDVLSEQSLDALLERIADTLAELIPYEDVHIYEADESNRELRAVKAFKSGMAPIVVALLVAIAGTRLFALPPT